MPFHGFFQFILVSPGREFKIRVQGIQVEIVAIGSGWRTGAKVSNLPKIVSSLNAASGKLFRFRLALGDLSSRAGNVIGHPMGKSAGARGVGIMNNERKGLNSGRSVPPRK